MPKLFPITAGLILTVFSLNAFAFCESERDEYERWNSRCEKLSATSELTGYAGGVFAFVTFGLSMAPCAAATAAAHNACRIMEEKKNNLERCESYHVGLATEGRKAEAIRLAKEKERQDTINQINDKYMGKQDRINAKYDQLIEDFVNSCAVDGWDLDDPETEALIQNTTSDFEAERNTKLGRLEAKRREELSSV